MPAGYVRDISGVRNNQMLVISWSYTFSGAFAKLRIGPISFVMSASLSVRPSLHMVQLGSNQRDFHETSYLSIFPKSVGKIQFSLKSEKRYLT